MSKRAVDMQGVGERGADGPETPMDTPKTATAAQLASRKILSVKGRPHMRPSSPVKNTASVPSFSFGTGQQNAPQPPSTQPVFNFSPSPPNGLANPFGQPQQAQSPAASNPFSFGQQPQQTSVPATTSFTFGNPTPQSTTFSFGFGQSSNISVAEIRNPFAQQDNQSRSQSTPPANVFNFTSPSSIATSASSGSIFSFGAAPASGLSDVEKKQILDRQYLLGTDQLKKFEAIVKDHIDPWDGTIKQNKIEQLPAPTQRELFDYVRALPPLSGTETRASHVLFADRGRGRTKQWVSDAQRAHIKQTASSMSPEQQEQLAQVARDESTLLIHVKSSELPALEQLPHDVQHKMWEYVQKTAAANQGTSLATSSGSKQNDQHTVSAAQSLSSGSTLFSGQSLPFDKTSANATPAIPNNIFSTISATATPAERRQSMGEGHDSNGNKTPGISNTQNDRSPKDMFTFEKMNETSTVQPATASSVSQFSFNGQSVFSPPKITHSTEPLPAFNFANNTKAIEGAQNPTSFLASSPQPQSLSTAMSNGQASEQPDLFAASLTKPRSYSGAGGKRSSQRSFDQTMDHAPKFVSARGDTWTLRSLNRALLQYLVTTDKAADWSPVFKLYSKLAQKVVTTSSISSVRPQTTSLLVNPDAMRNLSSPQTGVSASNTTFATTNGTAALDHGQKRKALEDISQSRYGPSSNEQESQATSQPPQSREVRFTPSKPLSQTASIFNDILDGPDKSSQHPPANAFMPKSDATQSSSVQPLFSTNTSQTPASSASGMPVFAAASGGTDFLAAFGKQAQSQADKDKAKRKAEEFDSDEDDEAEWERKDRERQAAKKREIENIGKKQMKMVDGKFTLVEESGSETTEGTKLVANSFSSSTSNATAPLSGQEKPSPPDMGVATNPFAHLTNNMQQTSSTNTQQPTWSSKRSSISSGFDQSIFAIQPSQSNSTFSFEASPPAANKASTTPTGSPAKLPTSSIFTVSSNAPTTNGQPSKTPLFNFSHPTASNRSPLFKPSNMNGTSLFDKTSSTTVDGSEKSVGGLGSSILAPSSGASLFPSQNQSRATTPGTTTSEEGIAGGKADEDEEEETSKEEQRDLTSLSASEIKTENVLFEQRARCRKFVRGGAEKWENKGVGVLRLLKNKETGNARILMRQDPSGAILLNANLIKQKQMYSMAGEKAVKMVFAGEAGELATYTVSFGTKDRASELEKVIHGLL